MIRPFRQMNPVPIGIVGIAVVVCLMLAAVGHPVIELERVRFGPLVLGSLPPGKWRHLAVHEIHALRKAARMKPSGR